MKQGSCSDEESYLVLLVPVILACFQFLGDLSFHLNEFFSAEGVGRLVRFEYIKFDNLTMSM